MKKVCANTNKLDAAAKNTAQGYVVFVEKESVEKALELNNTLQDSHRLRVDRAKPTHDASRSVFVGNLPYYSDETSLQALFVKKCGLVDKDVENVRIVRDKDTMKCKGFGYVLFDNKSMVATALQKMHGCVYMKRELRVTVCGKRFKGRRGQEKEASSDKKQKRSFEGKRASAADATGAFKRILGKKGAESSSPKKKKRARGDTKKSAVNAKKGVKKAGVSRRAAAEAKVGKRIKKIEKRVSKGMGKTRAKR
jgi:nucleolar protein 12